MLFLGIDAGGTKTHALVADQTGAVHGVGRAGPGNWEGVGLDGALAALQQAATEALAQADASPLEVTAAAYGLAGLDWPSDVGRLRPVVAQLGVSGPQVLVNDSLVALWAGARDPWGVVIIAGTGTTVAGRNREQETARTLGLGYPFDDWGSAPDLADACLHAVARAYTGRGPSTTLTGRLVQEIGACDAADLLEGVNRWQYTLEPAVPQIVRTLFQEAQSGDAVAREIVQRAGRGLGGGAVAVVRRLGMEKETFELVLSGGVFRSPSTLLLDTLRETVQAVAPGGRLVPLEAPPVVGAVLLATEQVGIEPAAVREALIASTDGLLRNE